MPRKKLDQRIVEEIKSHTYKWYEFGCKDASYLVTKEEFATLKISEKFLLRFHLATCKYCRRFVKQVNYIDTLLKASADPSALKMAPEKKIALNQAITIELSKSGF